MSSEPEATGRARDRGQTPIPPIPNKPAPDLRLDSDPDLASSRERPKTTPVDIERVDAPRDYAVDVSVLVPAKDLNDRLFRSAAAAANVSLDESTHDLAASDSDSTPANQFAQVANGIADPTKLEIGTRLSIPKDAGRDEPGSLPRSGPQPGVPSGDRS